MLVALQFQGCASCLSEGNCKDFTRAKVKIAELVKWISILPIFFHLLQGLIFSLYLRHVDNVRHRKHNYPNNTPILYETAHIYFNFTITRTITEITKTIRRVEFAGQASSNFVRIMNNFVSFIQF